MWSPSCILEQSRFQPAIVCKTRVLLIASATVRFIGVAILWVPIANAPAGFVQRSGVGKSLFSFNRTSGSCWRCKPVCRVKASNPGAIWATPPAPLPPRLRGHLRLQHRPPKFASSVTRLGESAALSPRRVFFDGTVRFPAERRGANQFRSASVLGGGGQKFVGSGWPSYAGRKNCELERPISIGGPGPNS
jgi:hypothetical protein